MRGGAARPFGSGADRPARSQALGIIADARRQQRLPALPTWQSAFYAARFNEFVIATNKSWDEAMLDLYPAELLSTPTPVHPPTLTPTRTPSWPIVSTPAP